MFRPYFDASANISNWTPYLHANVRNIKLSEYNNLFWNINCLSSIKYDNGREWKKCCSGFNMHDITELFIQHCRVLGNCVVQHYFPVIKHTQRSRDASRFCATWIRDRHRGTDTDISPKLFALPQSGTHGCRSVRASVARLSRIIASLSSRAVAVQHDVICKAPCPPFLRH